MKSQAKATMVEAKWVIGARRDFLMSVISMFLLNFKAHSFFLSLYVYFCNIPREDPHPRGHCANTQPDTGKLCAEFYAITYSQ